jgi:hypothetical protein
MLVIGQIVAEHFSLVYTHVTMVGIACNQSLRYAIRIENVNIRTVTNSSRRRSDSTRRTLMRQMDRLYPMMHRNDTNACNHIDS